MRESRSVGACGQADNQKRTPAERQGVATRQGRALERLMARDRSAWRHSEDRDRSSAVGSQAWNVGSSKRIEWAGVTGPSVPFWALVGFSQD
jgi:hypothetical protein